MNKDDKLEVAQKENIDLTRNAFVMALKKHINEDVWR